MTEIEPTSHKAFKAALLVFVVMLCAYWSMQAGGEVAKMQSSSSSKQQHESDSDFPVYEVNNMCRKLTMKQVNTMHWGQEGAALIEKNCLREEQVRYNNARILWRSASAETRRTCLANNDGTYHPYMVLEICLSGYFERDQINNQGAFHY